MERILVTGSAGLIGSHTVDKVLERIPNVRVVGIDNLIAGSVKNHSHLKDEKRFEFVHGDILDCDLLESLGDFDCVVHQAAVKKIWEKHSFNFVLKNNCDGTRNIVNLCNKTGAKLVFASTSDVYGMSSKLPFQEDDALTIGPSYVKRWAYALSKIYGEQLIFSHIEENNLRAVLLRYFGTYGPRIKHDWSGGPVPLFFKAINDGRPIEIHGDGSQTRCFVYVDDVTEATVNAIESIDAETEIINVGTDDEITILDLAKMCCEVAQKDVLFNFVPISNVFGDYKEILRRVPELSKMKKILGCNPKVGLKEGLEKTYADFS